MSQYEIGFFRHGPNAYAPKLTSPQKEAGLSITLSGLDNPSEVAPQQSFGPLLQATKDKRCIGIPGLYSYIGFIKEWCIAILGSLTRVYSSVGFESQMCIANLGQGTPQIYPNKGRTNTEHSAQIANNRRKFR